MSTARTLNLAARRRRGRLAWAALLAVVIVGSLLPGNSAPIRLLSGINDKLLHLGAYAALGFLPVLYEDTLGAVFSGITALGVGILLEYGQLFSVGRSFDVHDMLADGGGVALGLVLGWVLRLLVWR